MRSSELLKQQNRNRVLKDAATPCRADGAADRRGFLLRVRTHDVFFVSEARGNKIEELVAQNLVFSFYTREAFKEFNAASGSVLCPTELPLFQMIPSEVLRRATRQRVGSVM